MDASKGFAYCGLACCVCSENKGCAGCRNEGCKDKDWCKNYTCCQEKALAGCWECPEFPCEASMLDKLRIRAFARYIKAHGEDRLLARLRINEANGVVYHYEGQLVGDYDIPETEANIIDFIEHGKANHID